MTVKVVTDSTSSISSDVAEALGITVIPAYVQFGKEVYREGVEISSEGFYHKLITSSIHPVSSPPTPEDFADLYHKLSHDTEGIISIHISSKISETVKSALKAKKDIKGKIEIEIIDSRFSSIGLALVVMAAARLAQSGVSLRNIFEEVQRAISQISMLGIFDTMKYMVLGGRISKATASIGKVFNVKPLLTFQNGEIIRAGLVRRNISGIDRLYEFVASSPAVQDLAIAHSDVLDQANQLRTQLGSIFPEEKIFVTHISAALGVHSGPGALLVALRRKG